MNYMVHENIDLVKNYNIMSVKKPTYTFLVMKSKFLIYIYLLCKET